MEKRKSRSYGVIPVFKSKDGFLFCIIRQHQGHWGFPKGHRDEGESEEETARRELREEAGVDSVKFLDKYFIETYGVDRKGDIREKVVKYFLGLVDNLGTGVPENFKKEVIDLKWVNYEEVKHLLTFSEAKDLLEQVMEYLQPEAKK